MDSAEAKVRLRECLARVGTPPPDQEREFLSAFRMRKVTKGETLLLAGTMTTSVWFVASGMLRLYYTRQDGKEYNKGFTRPGLFSGSLESLLTKERSRLSIESLSDSILLEANYQALTSMYERDPFWERFGRVLAETLFVQKARREAALLMDSASTRYEQFMSEMGDIAELVPGYHVASFLGITPEALSRLRRARMTSIESRSKPPPR